MNGDITVRSERGAGASFTFEFDMGRIAEAPAAPVQMETATQVRRLFSGVRSILVVDDNASNRYVVRAFLKKLDLELVEAQNGAVALEALRQRPFDLVLLDMHMPVMDGQATFRAMRESGGPLAEIPVIALTADAADEDRDRYLALGMSGYLPKPIDRPGLLAEMQRVLEQHRAAA